MDEPELNNSGTVFERSLPNASEVEKALLGAILNDNSLMPEAIELVMPDECYVPSHKKIYLAMVFLFEVGQQLTPVLIAEHLKTENQLESVGGLSYITGLSYGMLPTTDIEPLCTIIREKAMLRRLIKASNKIVQHALAQEDPPSTILEQAGKSIFDITLEHMTKTFSQIGLLAHKSLQKAHLIQQQGTAITGLPIGFNDIDALTLGLQRTDLIILAARPSMGKTAFSVMLSANAAILSQARVAFFSLEMSEDQIANRYLCAISRVDSIRYRSGYLNSEEWGRLQAAEHQLAGVKIFIDDTPGISVLKIKAKCRRLIAEHGPLDLVVVDYLQLMDNDGTRNHYNREQEVSTISKDLKKLAKEINVPVVVLAQLSRKPEERSDHHPILSDLRESGSLEQDADLVFFLYREDMYKPKGDHEATYNHIAEVILAKQRNGPTGLASLRFDSPSGRFDPLYQQGQG